MAYYWPTASHGYDTRSRNDYGSKRICFWGIRAYNGLSKAFREQRNFQNFKRLACAHFGSMVNISRYKSPIAQNI